MNFVVCTSQASCFFLVSRFGQFYVAQGSLSTQKKSTCEIAAQCLGEVCSKSSQHQLIIYVDDKDMEFASKMSCFFFSSRLALLEHESTEEDMRIASHQLTRARETQHKHCQKIVRRFIRPTYSCTAGVVKFAINYVLHCNGSIFPTIC